MRARLIAAVGVTLLLLAATTVEAQHGGPLCQTGCLGGVQVTPDGGSESHAPNSGPWVVEFLVLNTSSTKKTFTFSCSPTGGISCVSVLPTSKALNPDQSTVVELSYNIGATGGLAGLLATASGASDDGYYTVTVTLPPGPPVITLKNFNGDKAGNSPRRFGLDTMERT